MKRNYLKFYVLLLSLAFCISSCNIEENKSNEKEIYYPTNILDYSGTPKSYNDRDALAFSDQGAWFAYNLPSDSKFNGSFSGPFLMTQENGIWASKALSHLEIINATTNEKIDLSKLKQTQNSYLSHLEQILWNENIKIITLLYFQSAHTAIIKVEIQNLNTKSQKYNANWNGELLTNSLQLNNDNNQIIISSSKSSAKLFIQNHGTKLENLTISDSTYSMNMEVFELKAHEKQKLYFSQTVLFPENSIENENIKLTNLSTNYEKYLLQRVDEKKNQLNSIYSKTNESWTDTIYKNLVTKTLLTLQNNWRIPAGELKHSGLFPSYHYIWFNGFWAWDSWKHAAALAYINPELAKEQIRVMYDHQFENGFIPDCIYRDTTIEAHNYRNTKPPLSAWAVWKVFEQSKDSNFIREMYSKIINQHKWWYEMRDHDKDGICEYGSTDGTLIAAKWESGMDNAVRFDESKLVENAEGAFSLDQESVDLNAYLYAEKKYLVKMAEIMENESDKKKFLSDAKDLKIKIQEQFFDKETGWFYDTSLDGKTFIKAKGCEGWIPLWADAAANIQAESVKNNMMNPEYFNTLVPLQTLSASHPKFKPNRGYWRGPVWVDQSYFGIMGLKNYHFKKEANELTKKLFHNSAGLLENGPSIRENYQPITGDGLESENFSWSAAHYLLMMIEEKP